MGDMSRCPHDTAVGYCDICSPGWEEMLFTHSVQDDIYQRGIAKGRKETEAEITELKQKLAAAESAPLAASAIDAQLLSSQAATIESLNLRVARLVDALTYYANGDHFMPADDTEWDTVSGEPANFQSNCTDYDDGLATVEDGSIAKQALSSESDNQWLREKQAEAIIEASEHPVFRTTVEAGQIGRELLRMAYKLRNQSPESDIDQATRTT